MKTLLACVLLLAPALSAQTSKPTKPAPVIAKLTEVDKLRAEAVRLKKQLVEARALQEARAEIARLKKELADVKRGKKTARKPKVVRKPVAKKPAPVSKRIRPVWLPKLNVGEVRVVQDVDGVWWFVERRHGDGHLSLHEYGKGKAAEKTCRAFADKVRRNPWHATPKSK